MNDHSNEVVKTADVIGKSVIGVDNDKLGKIEEIVIDKVSGQVRYAVLSFGGFMGMGSDFYALPWAMFDYQDDEDAFKINVSKEKLKSATGFNKDEWPDFADEEWINKVHNYYEL